MSRLSLGFHDGVETRIRIDGNSIITEDVQDNTPIIDRVTALSRLGQNKESPLRYVGSTSLVEYEKWKREFKEKYSRDWTWKTYLAMKLNSRDFSQFRTEGVRV